MGEHIKSLVVEIIQGNEIKRSVYMKREDIEKEKVRENIIRELKKRYDIDTIEELKEMNKKLKLNIGVFTK